jgi:hypothetical protein
MLQRVNPPQIHTNRIKKTTHQTTQNEEPELSVLLIPCSCSLLQDQIPNAVKQVSGCAMASSGVPSMASQVARHLHQVYHQLTDPW